MRKYKSEILGSIICLALGMLSGYITKSSDYLWYAGLNKPFFTPPNWIFAPVWIVLYIMLGVAIGKIWDQKPFNKTLFSLFTAQFICNLLWTPLFFHFHRIDLALYDIGLLFLFLCLFMINAFKERVVFYLFLPYFLWSSFAFLLTYTVFSLN